MTAQADEGGPALALSETSGGTAENHAMRIAPDTVLPSAASEWPILHGFIAMEERAGAQAAKRGGFAAFAYGFGRFGIKQGWASLFGALLLALLIATRLFYPQHAPIARYDALVIGAVLIQAILLRLRMETPAKAGVILVFHVLGTIMELFKTHVGAWIYPETNVLRIGGVPLFTGFLYGAVGSYLTRAWHLFDLRFSRHPPLFALVLLAAAIYANFFADHWRVDMRYPLVLATVLLFGRCRVFFKSWRRHRWMPLLLGFGLVALFIWFAENIGTGVGAWIYPNQRAHWSPVPISKLVSWFLLMLVSYTTVAASIRPLSMRTDTRQSCPRLRRLGLALVLLGCGLAWVLVPHGLPRFWQHNVGSVLWGAMLFCLVSALRRGGAIGTDTILASLLIAAATEATRLVGWASLDGFRHTFAGVLLLGRVFDPRNMLCYAAGIGAAALFCRFYDRRSHP